MKEVHCAHDLTGEGDRIGLLIERGTGRRREPLGKTFNAEASRSIIEIRKKVPLRGKRSK